MSEKKYSDNTSINNKISKLLDLFDNDSKIRMQETIQIKYETLQKHSKAGSIVTDTVDSHARHIFREFLIGEKLNEFGYHFEYDKEKIGKGKNNKLTPDWVDETQKILIDSITYERGGKDDLFKRTTKNVRKKCNRYKEVIHRNNYKFIVSVYIDFLTNYSIEDVQEAPEKIWKMFNLNNNLWGVIFFNETKVLNGIQEYDFIFYCKDDRYKNLPFGFIKTKNINDIHNENMLYLSKIHTHLEKLKDHFCLFKYNWSELKTLYNQNPNELVDIAAQKQMHINSYLTLGLENHIFNLLEDNSSNISLIKNYKEFENHSKINSQDLNQIIEDFREQKAAIEVITDNESTEVLITEIDKILNLVNSFINYISSNVVGEDYICNH